MSRVAVIVGHARKDTFCEALGEAYRVGAAKAGHEVRLFVTSKMSFDPILHTGYGKLQPLERDLEDAHAAILAANHLVFIFPLWMGTLPAILKGFLERILQPEMAVAAKAGQFVKPLKGKSARIIVTMGMPGFVYRWWFGAFAVRMMKRNMLGFVGVSPVRSSVFGSIDSLGLDGRSALLAKTGEMGRLAI